MRIGFVGLGAAARELHIPALTKIARAVPVGGCDTSPEARERWCSATGLPAVASLDEMLDRFDPEAVVVASPPDSHAELCVAALERGAHVICEKPIAATPQDADRILDAAAGRGRRVAVNHHFRYQPIFRAVRERVESGAVGELVFCRIEQLMSLPPWSEPTAWRAGMSDRALLEGGIHLVDLLVYLFGEPPSFVTCHVSGGRSEHRAADAIQLLSCDFGDGRLAQLSISRLCPAATRFVELRADCESASLRASVGGRLVVQAGKKRAERLGVRVDWGIGGLAWAERGLRRTSLARNPRNASVHATRALLEDALDAFAEDREPSSSGRAGRDAVAVVDAAYRSAAEGVRVAPRRWAA